MCLKAGLDGIAGKVEPPAKVGFNIYTMGEDERKIFCLSMPLKVNELVSTVGMMAEGIERRRHKARLKPRKRNAQEESAIREAKRLLMVLARK